MPAGRQAAARRRGSILLLSLFFMTVLFLLGVGLFKLIPVEFQAAHRSRNDLMGHYVANAGIRHAVSWLSERMEEFDATQDPNILPDYTDDNGATYPNLVDYTADQNARAAEEKTGSEDWDYQLAINVQPGQPTTLQNFDPRVFAITSTALHRGTPVRQVDVIVRQASFASFAFYSDRFTGAARWVIDGDTGITGPVHTNDYHKFEVADSNHWTDPNTKPYFLDEVSHSAVDSSAPSYGDGNQWLAETPYDTNGPIAGYYEKVFEGGRNSLKPKDYVQLPSNTDSLAERAYGDSAIPTLQGVYINEDNGAVKGGILINGRVDWMEARLDQSGNQVFRIGQNEKLIGTETVTKYKNVPYSPPKYNAPHQHCQSGHYETIPAGGGLSEPQTIYVCDSYYTHQDQLYQQVPDGTVTQNDYANSYTEVFEVTEAPVTLNGETANVGQTLIRDYQRDANNVWQLVDVRVLDGLPNGTIYVQQGDADGDGDFGDSREKANLYDLKGIIKGAAEIDPDTGQIATDANGDKIYNNKTIAADISSDGQVFLGGDLLQFSQEKFDAAGTVGGGVLGNPANWKNVALDPNRTTGGVWDPELSPSKAHALGLIARDVWMRGPTSSNTWNGNDNYNDVYAVILAGKTHVDSNGEVIVDANDRPVTSGGFGTEYSRRDQANDPLGRFRIMGGVIQGTTGANPGWNANHTHAWRSGDSGYDVSMMFDNQASRQGIFPVYPQFSILRYTERSARG